VAGCARAPGEKLCERPSPRSRAHPAMRPSAPDVVFPQVLTAKQVSLSRGGQLVLNRVSISVAPGSRVGIVGPNGIGKTTLLRVLAGLEAPDTGTVERSPTALTVGYLAQEPDAAPSESLCAYLSRRTGIAAASGAL